MQELLLLKQYQAAKGHTCMISHKKGNPVCKSGGIRLRKSYNGPGFIHDDTKDALAEAITASDDTYNNGVPL
eukprot:4563916-Ditylum_brightwellii.AAC.1